GRCRVVVCAHQDLPARVNPSPFDRTVAFIRRRYRGDPVAAVGIALVVLWAAWVVVYLLEHRHYTFRVVGTQTVSGDISWYTTVGNAITEIGSGVVVVAGVVWLPVSSGTRSRRLDETIPRLAE